MRIFLEPPAAMLTATLVALALELTLRDVVLFTCNVWPPFATKQVAETAGKSRARGS